MAISIVLYRGINVGGKIAARMEEPRNRYLGRSSGMSARFA